MSMVKKSISVTDRQDSRIKARIETGRYGNGSEIIRERQTRGAETLEEIEAIRATLIAAEESVKEHGYNDKSVDEIWEEAKARHRSSLARLWAHARSRTGPA